MGADQRIFHQPASKFETEVAYFTAQTRVVIRAVIDTTAEG